ncbi:hypothetical protein CVT24_001691, partial [Panaeolus cyanescens]
GEAEHTRSKKFYSRTNKGSGFQNQIATHYRRQNIIRRIGERISNLSFNTTTPNSSAPPSSQPPSISITAAAGASVSADQPIPPVPPAATQDAQEVNPNLESDELQTTVSPEHHYHLPVSKKKKINVYRWVHSNQKDPAFKDFLNELKSHILSRILQDDSDSTYTKEELSHLELSSDALYEHSVLRVNYTTYDLRRSQDSLNPRTHNDILTLSRDDNPSHPFSYARIIGAFHAEITYNGSRRQRIVRPARIDFLWVCWFELDQSYQGGWAAKRLHRVRFVPCANGNAFGFLDPDCVIRGTHLIPAFAHGTTSEYLPYESIARNKELKDIIGHEDYYRYYYVNMFVDRDMSMRYLGGGIGHAATNELTKCLRPDYMSPPAESATSAMDVEDLDDSLEIEGIEAVIDLEEEEEDQDTDSEDNEDGEGGGVDRIATVGGALAAGADSWQDDSEYAPL